MEHKILRQRKMTGKNRRKLTSDRLTLRPKETTALTGLSVGATYELLESGAMPSIRIGKKYLIAWLRRELGATGNTSRGTLATD